MKLFVLLAWLVAGSVNSMAQAVEDSLPHHSLPEPKAAAEKALMLSKARTNAKTRKVILLKKGRKVWVQYQDVNGKFKLRRVKILEVKDHQFTVRPVEYFTGNERTLTDSISVIGYTNAGIIIPVFILDTGIVVLGIASGALVVALSVLLVFDTIFSRSSSNIGDGCGCLGDAFRDVGKIFQLVLPFHRDIKLYKKQWKLETVEMLP